MIRTASAPELVVALALSAFALAGPAPAAAQGSTADPFLLPNLVVTASHVPVDRDRLPTLVVVLTGSELEAQGIETVADALRTVPGLAVVSAGPTGAQTSLFLRGGESDYVKVLVDGVPLNGGGGSIDLADLSTDGVERIEVLKGPASVLHGSDAVTGVVQIFTLRGRGAPRLEVTGMGGLGERRLVDERHGTSDLDASLTGSSGPVSYAVGGGHSWSSGTYALNNENTLATGAARVAWNPGTGTSLSLTARLSDGAYHYPTDGSGNPVDANQVTERGSWIAALGAGRPLGERFAAELHLGASRRHLVTTDRQDGPSDTSGQYISDTESEVRRLEAEVRVVGTLGVGTLTFGTAHEALAGEAVGSSSGEFGDYTNEADYERSTTSGFAELISDPIDGLTTTAGLRLDQNTQFGTFQTFRLGVSWAVRERTRLRAGLGRAFREPGFDENFGSGYGDVGNSGLVPERTFSWEVGVEQGAGPFRLAGTWFDQSFRDLVQYVSAPAGPGDPNYENLAAADAYGLELGVAGSRGAASFSAGYTWLHTEVTDPGNVSDATFPEGGALVRRPRHSGNVAVRFERGALGVGLRAELVGSREDIDFAPFPFERTTLASYATVGVSAEYALALGTGPETALLFSVQNLLDAEYQEVLGFATPGRLARVGVRMTLGGS